MKTALILGITGGFGSHVAEALARRGWRLRALVRDPARVPTMFRGIDLVTGDAANLDDVRRAAMGAQVLVYGINAPYTQWEHTVLPWLEVSAQVAEEQRLTVVFPGNIYGFHPDDGTRFHEQSPQRPPTPKGHLRLAMEARLERATQNGARVLILRAGNFIGARARSTWLGHLIRERRNHYELAAAGPRALKTAWANLPDVAASIALLLERETELPAYGVWHYRGYEVSFDDFAAAIETATGKPVRMTRFPWWFMRLIAPFSAWSRSLLEMRYVWEREMLLDETKLAMQLGHEPPRTPLPQALLDAGLVARRADAGVKKVPV